MKDTTDYVALARNNYLKVIVKDCKNQKKLDRFVESLQTNSKDEYKIEVIQKAELMENIDTSLLEETIKKNSSPMDVVSVYVETASLDDGIEKNRLSDILEVLYHEATLGV